MLLSADASLDRACSYLAQVSLLARREAIWHEARIEGVANNMASQPSPHTPDIVHYANFFEALEVWQCSRECVTVETWGTYILEYDDDYKGAPV